MTDDLGEEWDTHSFSEGGEGVNRQFESTGREHEEAART